MTPALKYHQPTGVSNLIYTTYNASHPSGARGAGVPIPMTELHDIRYKMFQAGAEVYSDPKRVPIWANSILMKDALSHVFRDDFDKIWRGALAKNNAVFDDESGINTRLEGFFQHALFTQPTGGFRDKTSEFLASRMNGWMEDIKNPKMSKQEFVAKYGLEKTQLTHIMGETMGFVTNGMQAAMKSAQDHKAANEAAMKWVMDLGLSLLPGVGPARSVVGLEGSNVLGKIVDGVDKLVRDKIKDMTKDEAAKYLLKQLPGLHPDKVMTELFQELREVVPGKDEQDLLSALQSSYTHIDLNPAVQ